MNDQPIDDQATHDHEVVTKTKHDPGAHAPTDVLDIDELLETAKRPERIATIVMRSDLLAERDQLLAELSTLVTPSGEILGNADTDAGSESNEGRAHRLYARLQEVLTLMRESQRFVRFVGMSGEDFQIFNRAHRPKKQDASFDDYNRRLVVVCAVEPSISAAQYDAMRKKLSQSQMAELINRAFEACTEDGIDVPKLPAFLRKLAQQ